FFFDFANCFALNLAATSILEPNNGETVSPLIKPDPSTIAYSLLYFGLTIFVKKYDAKNAKTQNTR
ncbi:hypothetical protein, partial [Escherichia coli]